MQAPPSASSEPPAKPSSPSSYSLDDQDESVRIAVRALGAMRNGQQTQSQITSTQPTPALSLASSTSSTSLPSPSLPPAEVENTLIDPNAPQQQFASRMSHLPLVNTVLSVYESGKNSSRVMKYGAEMMESSVKTISRPVIDRLPVNVNQLDEFACRQLDRIGRYRRPSEAELERMQIDERDRDRGRDDSAVDVDDAWSSGLQSSEMSARNRRGKERSIADSPSRKPPPAPSESNGEIGTLSNDDATPGGDQNQQQVAQRSRWQAVLLEAGGISAALSEESMRKLKYCLQWLQYATSHIDAQILVLRDFTASLQSSTNNPAAIISPQHMRTLTNVRKDVVQTIRQVVDVVSKYAGGALPEPARSRVRGFILHLPQRWASAASGEGVAKGAGGGPAIGGVPVPAGSAVRRGRGSRYQHHRERGTGSESARSSQPGTPSSSRPTSPIASPRLVPRRELQANGHGHAAAAGPPPTAGAATQAAQRILTLSTESLDMMRGVTAVVKESLDRADAWVERLRIIGLQRQQHEPEAASEPGSESDPLRAFRGPPGPLTPALSEVGYGYGFPSSPPGPGTPGLVPNGIDAPSPGVSYELGGLSIDTEPASASATPKNGLKSLPEADGEHAQTEKWLEKQKGESPEEGDDLNVKDGRTVPGPEPAKMDVDA